MLHAAPAIGTGTLARALAALALLPALASAQQATCVRPPSLGLDHAIVVVRDLDSAQARLAPLGFRFKSGRLHADSLLNRHIKFRDGSELELMTLAGRPTSDMARDYASLLSEGEGGVYAALWTTQMDSVRTVAARLGATPRTTTIGPWEFVSLPAMRDAAAVFFGAGGTPANDPDSVLNHPNGAVGLESAWVEAGPGLEQLLRQLGGVPCERVTVPDGRSGMRWLLARGSLVIVPLRAGQRDPRLVGVELRRERRSPEPMTAQPIPGFWVELR